PGKSRESTQSAGLFTALSVWTVARKRQLAAWRGGFMQQRPLSQQAIALLSDAEKIKGSSGYVFKGTRAKHMSRSTILFALYRLGYHSRMTGHGFRGLASTMLHEQGFSPDVIERQLAHAERNKVRAAYNHAQYLPERRRMMQHWADHLDQLAAG
ncbi:tyrosine-type recombinase/integrase, partial [Ralstonia pseudosolanacearum]|uniref:tyrosine-type recombinase/integrase n=2 Tax=Ralstonia pseudosolanacearum TaxID=1310165 RepID=UPI0018D1B42D